MNVRNVALWAGLMWFAPTVHANGQAASVKDSQLARVRDQLTRYDLEPQGTLALLPQLEVLARTLESKPDAAEAAFLRVAVASDLLFLAEYLNNAGLRTNLATQFGVPPEQISAALQGELQACAKGLYREPALAVLAALQRTGPAAQPPTGPADLRRDAQFLRAAVELATDDAVGGRWAALARDPCVGPPTCAAPYADFDPEGRRALAYMQQLSAAAVRLEHGRGLGDPLLDALWNDVERNIARLRAMSLRLPPRVLADSSVLTPDSISAWPAPDLVAFIQTEQELRYAHTPRVQIDASGDVARVPTPAPTFPETIAIPHKLPDTNFATRVMEDVVNAMRAARGQATAFRAALIVETGVTALFPARVLVSMRKAGVPQLVFAARTKDGRLLAVPVQVVLPTVDTPGPDADLKLRVRLGGYSLDIGHGTEDIPRVRDETGLHFDVDALRSQAKARAPRSAAVSFMPDVATDQVLLGLWNVTLQREPVHLAIQ